MSAYLDQNSDLQEEYANKLAEIYKLGCEFVYFDGSEGTNLPTLRESIVAKLRDTL